MLLDLREVRRVAEAGGLEQVAGVAPQRAELGQLLPVALEVAVVDGVEAGQRREQPDVGLGDRVAHEVAAVGQPLLEPVQRGEQPLVGLVVGALRAGEPAAVHPVVDLGVDALHDLAHLVPQVLGVEVGRALAVELRPLGREVERDLREVVGDDGLGRDVDDRRHRDALRVLRVAGEVGLLQPLVAQHRVAAAGVEVEGPAALVVRRAAQAHRDRRLQAEQPPHDDRAVGPRAGAGGDQPVAARLDRPAVAAVGGDPVGDVLVVPLELRLDVPGPAPARVTHVAQLSPTGPPPVQPRLAPA